MASVFTGQGILCPAPKLPPSSTFEDSVLCSPGWSGTYSVAETGLDPPVPSPRCWNYLQASATVFSPYIVLNLKKDKSALGILTANMPFSWSKKETKGKKKKKEKTERKGHVPFYELPSVCLHHVHAWCLGDQTKALASLELQCQCPVL